MKSDILKLWTFVIASLIGGALLTPWLFEAGKGLAEAELNHPTGVGAISWLAEKARSHPYEDFFKRSLTIVAVLLLYPTYRWIKKSEAGSNRHQLKKNPVRFKDWALGFIVASNLLLTLGFLGVSTGFYEFDEPIEVAKGLKKAIGPALGAGIIEELLFRGALLGIFLRSCKSSRSAAIGLSVLFAVVHLLQPPPGIQVDEANAGSGTGFWILGQIGMRFLEPSFFIAEVCTLFLIGLVLASARIRTASLWLPIGLHMGWVFSYTFFKRITERTEEGSLWLIGDTLKEGVAPLLVVGLTWWLVNRYLAKRPQTS